MSVDDAQVHIHFGPGYGFDVETDDPFFFPTYIYGENLSGLYHKDNIYYWQEGKEKTRINIRLPNGNIGKTLKTVFIRRFNQQPINGLLVEDPATRQRYVYAVEGKERHQLILDHLPLDAGAGIFEDANGNWWYNTSTGLVRTNNSLLTFDNTNPDMVIGLHAISEDQEGRIWLGGYNDNGGWSAYNNGKLENWRSKDKPMAVLPGPMRDADGIPYFLTEYEPNRIFAIIDGRPQAVHSRGFDEIRAAGLFLLPLSNGKIGIGSASIGLGIATINNPLDLSVRNIGPEKGLEIIRIHTLAEDAAGRLWIGHLNTGIGLYDPARDTAVSWKRDPKNVQSFGAISSCIDENGSLWLGTNMGLYRLPNASALNMFEENIFSKSQPFFLPGNDKSIVGFLKNLEDFLVVGTQQAVYLIDKKYRGPRPRIFTLQYGKDIAGMGSEQNAVYFDSKGFLWIGADDCATRFDPKQMRFDTSAVAIEISLFTAGDDTISVQKGSIGNIPAKKRHIFFNFRAGGNNFLADDLFYDVVVLGADGDTVFQNLSTKEREVNLPYLKYGDYQIRLFAYKHNVLVGDATYTFSTPQLLSEKTWFWLFLLSSLAGAAFYIYYQNSKKKKMSLEHALENERSQRERDGLKALAMSNFFKPHFINNALGTIQGILQKDPDAVLIIDRLGKVVNQLFTNTQKNKTAQSLQLEIDILKNYLDIQKVRYRPGFQYEIHTPPDETALQQTLIPSMLLQIHAENAVEKGIRGRTGAGILRLFVTLEPNGCSIKIEDDGRLREVTPNKSRKGSTDVMNELVNILNTYNTEKISIRFEDAIFISETGKKYGTCVHIFIPKNYRYELS